MWKKIARMASVYHEIRFGDGTAERHSFFR
jgi:hypothetical protein